MKILMSAHEMGSARQYQAFAEYCRTREPSVDLCIVVSDITAPVFADRTISVQSFPSHYGNRDHASVRSLSCLLEEFHPDYVLVGLSSYPDSLDDMLLQMTRRQTIPNGAIQDYWGYLGNWAGPYCPDTFFVLDQAAEALTKQRAPDQVESVITGSPKHEAYKHKVYNHTTCFADNEKKRLVFFGQPKSFPEIEDNLGLFIRAVSQISTPVQLAYKPHPADKGFEDYYLQRFNNQPHDFSLVSSEEPAEPYLAQADLIVTCFSTIGLDHNYLQYYADHPLGNLVYVMIGDPILELVEQQVGIPDIPGSLCGMGRTVKAYDHLVDALYEGLFNDRLREEYRATVMSTLHRDETPCETIVQHIQNHVNQKRTL